MRCAGVLLTGGASRRMGRDKATIDVGGTTLAARAARVLRAVCDPVVEVGSGVSGLEAVREDPPGAGPLAALLTGARVLDARVGGSAPVLLFACDLPFVEPALLRLLAEWPDANDRAVVPVVGGRHQYVCARYGPASLVAATGAYDRGERSLRGAFADLVVAVSESTWREVAPAHALDDVDTPDDLARVELTNLAGRPDR